MATRKQDGSESVQPHALARRRAERRMAQLYGDQFTVFFHEEKHRLGLGHRHDPDNPESIAWWGPEPEQAPS